MLWVPAWRAALPGEAVALRRQDCHLPRTGWGWLTLEKSRPDVNQRWTDTASAHDERGPEHRDVTETKRVPTCSIPLPETRWGSSLRYWGYIGPPSSVQSKALLSRRPRQV
jgi:hypothetical protein